MKPSLAVLGIGVLLSVLAWSRAKAHQQDEGRPVYGVAQIQIHDREGYRQYEAGFLPIFERYGGELLAVDESAEILEGEWPWTRTVLVRFSSQEELEAWFHSPEYQALAEHRHRSSRANIVVLHGR